MRFFLLLGLLGIVFCQAAFAADQGGRARRASVFVFSHQDIEASLSRENHKRWHALDEYHKNLLQVSINSRHCLTWAYFKQLHLRARQSMQRLLDRSVAVTDFDIESIKEAFSLPIEMTHYVDYNRGNYLKSIKYLYLIYKDIVTNFVSIESTKEMILSMLDTFIERINSGFFVVENPAVSDFRFDEILELKIEEAAVVKSVKICELTDVLGRAVFSAAFNDGELFHRARTLFDGMQREAFIAVGAAH
jgi:hypothetical protein